MSKLPPLPCVDVFVDHRSPCEGIFDILCNIRPTWRRDDVEIKPLPRGVVNLMYRCYLRSTEHESAMVFRVFGDNKGLADCFNREAECDVMRVLSHRGLFPQMHCRFINGTVYGYAEGRRMTRNHMTQKHILKKVADYMHSIHQIDFLAYLDELKPNGLLMFIDRPWDIVQSMDYRDVEADVRYKACLPPLKELRQEQERVHELYAQLSEDYPIVLCHADAHIFNIVYDEVSDRLTFVDWESLQWCPEIVEPVMFYDRDGTSSDVFKDDVSRMIWLEVYLSTHPVYGKQPITDEVLNTWFIDSLKASMITHFITVSYALAAIKNTKDQFDFYGLAIQGYEQYKASEKQLKILGAL